MSEHIDEALLMRVIRLFRVTAPNIPQSRLAEVLSREYEYGLRQAAGPLRDRSIERDFPEFYKGNDEEAR